MDFPKFSVTISWLNTDGLNNSTVSYAEHTSTLAEENIL